MFICVFYILVSSLLNLQQIINDCYHKTRLGLYILGVFTGFLQSLLYCSDNISDQSPRAMRYRFVKLDFSSGKRAFQSYIPAFSIICNLLSQKRPPMIKLGSIC